MAAKERLPCKNTLRMRAEQRIDMDQLMALGQAAYRNATPILFALRDEARAGQRRQDALGSMRPSRFHQGFSREGQAGRGVSPDPPRAGRSVRRASGDWPSVPSSANARGRLRAAVAGAAPGRSESRGDGPVGGDRT
jgi:hypothetical protein